MFSIRDFFCKKNKKIKILLDKTKILINYSSSEEESSSMTSLLLCFGLKREGAGASSSEPRAFFFFFRPLMAEPASASDSLSLIRPSSASFLFLCSRKKYILRMSWSLITFRRFRSRGAVLELLRRLVYFF